MTADLAVIGNCHGPVSRHKADIQLTDGAGGNGLVGHIVSIQEDSQIHALSTCDGIVQADFSAGGFVARGIHTVNGEGLPQLCFIQLHRDVKAAALVHHGLCRLDAFQLHDDLCAGLGAAGHVDGLLSVVTVGTAEGLTVDRCADLQQRTGTVHAEAVLRPEAVAVFILAPQCQHMLALGHILRQGDDAVVGRAPIAGLCAAIQRPAAGNRHIRGDLEGNLVGCHYINGVGGSIGSLGINHCGNRLGTLRLHGHIGRCRLCHGHFTGTHGFARVDRNTVFVVAVSGDAYSVGLAGFQRMGGFHRRSLAVVFRLLAGDGVTFTVHIGGSGVSATYSQYFRQDAIGRFHDHIAEVFHRHPRIAVFLINGSQIAVHGAVRRLHAHINAVVTAQLHGGDSGCFRLQGIHMGEDVVRIYRRADVLFLVAANDADTVSIAGQVGG